MAKRTKDGRKKPGILPAILMLLLLCAIGFGVVWSYNVFTMSFNIPESEVVEVDYGDVYKAPHVEARLYGTVLFPNGLEANVVKEGRVDTNTLGTYTETYTADIFGFYEKTIDRTIKVVDNTAPVIKLEGDTEVTLDQNSEFTDPGCKATDNYDGDITANIQVTGEVDTETPGDYTLTYQVSDSSGNEAKATRSIHVNDNEAPAITLEGDREMTLLVGEVYTEPGYSAVDNADGEIEVTVEGEPDVQEPGTYVITYRAVDSAGNEATITRTVYVSAHQQSTVDPGNKVVYLTFDDGPGKFTDELLEVLDRYNVKVTFFVTNQFPGYQDCIAKEAAAGHTVAVHSYSHDFAKVYASEEAYFADYNKMADIIQVKTGVRPSIVRYPGGTSNEVSKQYSDGIMTTITASCDRLGISYCDWNVDSNDAGGASSAEEVANNVIEGLKSHNVSYVLQHDIKGFSVEAVEQIIQWGLENGYTFLPLTESSPMCHHKVHN